MLVTEICMIIEGRSFLRMDDVNKRFDIDNYQNILGFTDNLEKYDVGVIATTKSLNDFENSNIPPLISKHPNRPVKVLGRMGNIKDKSFNSSIAIVNPIGTSEVYAILMKHLILPTIEKVKSKHNLSNYRESVPGFSDDLSKFRTFDLNEIVLSKNFDGNEQIPTFYKHYPNAGTKVRVLGKTTPSPSSRTRTYYLAVNVIGTNEVYLLRPELLTTEDMEKHGVRIFDNLNNYKNIPGYTTDTGSKFELHEIVEIGKRPAETTTYSKICGEGTHCRIMGRAIIPHPKADPTKEYDAQHRRSVKFLINPVNTPFVLSMEGWSLHKLNNRTEKVRYRREKDDEIPCSFCHKLFSMDMVNGRHRNHCPHCLHSVHVDVAPGDRMAWCGTGTKGDNDDWTPSILTPIGITDQYENKSIISKCEKCGVIKVNKIATDDNQQEISRLPDMMITSGTNTRAKNRKVEPVPTPNQTKKG